VTDPATYRDSLRGNGIPTWVRVLAGAVLLDPAALRRSAPAPAATAPAASQDPLRDAKPAGEVALMLPQPR
jgi:hypothetical protein